MKYTTFCASSDYPNRMSGWLGVSFGADQGGKDRFCQLRQRVVDAHVFAYRGICAPGVQWQAGSIPDDNHL